mgnify:CR=1 FL=1
MTDYDSVFDNDTAVVEISGRKYQWEICKHILIMHTPTATKHIVQQAAQLCEIGIAVCSLC